MDYLLQDWVTVTAVATTPPNILQPASCWLDLGHARELEFFLDVSQRTGGDNPTIRYETAAFRDSSSFQEMSFDSLAVTTNASVKKIFLYDNPSVPLGRFVRWRLTSNSGTAWSATFRVTVMAYRR